MTRAALVPLILTLAAAPVAAAETGDPPSGDGARRFLERLIEDLGPLIEELSDRLGAIEGYHPPEILPNGDIIIRRKRPRETPPRPRPDRGIEL